MVQSVMCIPKPNNLLLTVCFVLYAPYRLYAPPTYLMQRGTTGSAMLLLLLLVLMRVCNRRAVVALGCELLRHGVRCQFACLQHPYQVHA